MSNYLLRHAQVLLATLGQMARAPLATLLTLIVIGITLALPSGLFVMLDNLERVSAGWDRGARASLFLKRNVTEAGARKLAQQIRAMSCGEPASTTSRARRRSPNSRNCPASARR